jgi:3-methyladenine DNA glycosylase AlkD
MASQARAVDAAAAIAAEIDGLPRRDTASVRAVRLAICRRLAGDRDDIVEKATSWALRVLSQRDRPAVARFMAEMGEGLAARVRREVRNKLASGLKTPRKTLAATAD